MKSSKPNLIKPNGIIIDKFNNYWIGEYNNEKIQLFLDGDEVDVESYLKGKNYSQEDEQIKKATGIEGFLNAINVTYNTRIENVCEIIRLLEEHNIHNKNDIEDISLPEFVSICKLATGKYTYSFASKVYNFLNERKYPIIDSISATLLNNYEYENKIRKSKWGNYEKYTLNYNNFKEHFSIESYSFKEIDIFLWLYGKLILAYWSEMGIFGFESVQFDTSTIKNDVP